MERFFDIVFSAFALIAISPLLIPIIVILKFSGEGEIFFLQDRIGRNGEIFKLYKFATMLKNSANIGTGTITMKNDPRILPVGKFLRQTKINELPQLINILYGDMSIVGPRPLTKESFSSYSRNTQKVIKLVKPGLSGVGSILFRREEDILSGKKASINFYDEIIAPYKGELEEWFVMHKTLYLYFRVIILTVWVVLFPKSNLPWLAFSDLPEPPSELKSARNYREK